jgi:hypothetical protein
MTPTVAGAGTPGNRTGAFRWRQLVGVPALAACLALPGCGHTVLGPSGPLATGRWTSDSACLAVADSGCDLIVGCGHGRFSRPVVGSDGRFEVDGTYRIEAGPISTTPPPPAHFSGSLNGSRLTLTVAPTSDGLPPATFIFTLTGGGNCPVQCL